MKSILDVAELPGESMGGISGDEGMDFDDEDL